MQRCRSPHDEGVLAVSSTSSVRQLRKPDDRTCWGGETVPPTDDEQQNADVAWRQLKRPEHSTSPGTGERIHWDGVESLSSDRESLGEELCLLIIGRDRSDWGRWKCRTGKCRTWKCRTKLQGMKMQDLKMRDQIAGPENAGPENGGPSRNAASLCS